MSAIGKCGMVSLEALATAGMDWIRGFYHRSPIWLQTLAVSAVGLRLRRLRYGGVHEAAVAELRRSQWFRAEELVALQLDRLRDTLGRAFSNVPLYGHLWGGLPEIRDLEGLRGLPPVSKAEMQTSRNFVTSASFAGKSLHEVHTGGTTGRTLTIYCTPSVLQVNYAFFARLREWAGVLGRGRVATFAGRAIVPPAQSDPPFWRHNLAARQLLCSSYHLSERSLPAYVNALSSFAPDLIDSYPSSIEPIARFMLEHGIRGIRPRAVITSSETLSPAVRELISQAFEAPVFDYYGGAEMAALITQCQLGTYHPNPEFGVVEILRDGVPAGPGQAGEIVATGFINPVMPFIRYRTGDLAVPGGRSCECGRAFPTLERVIGRLDDVVITPDGRRVGRLDPIFKGVSSLYEARVIQDAEDHVQIEVVVRGRLRDHERQELIRQTSLRLGPTMRVDVSVVAAIPRTRSGKLRMVENRVHPPSHDGVRWYDDDR